MRTSTVVILCFILGLNAVLFALVFLAGAKFRALSERAPFVTNVRLAVPPHKQGDNPMLLLTRTFPPRKPDGTIEKSLLYVSITHLDAEKAFTEQCLSLSTQRYAGRRTTGFPLYRGMDSCDLEPGEYNVDICWFPDNVSYKRVCASAPFTISGRD